MNCLQVFRVPYLMGFLPTPIKGKAICEPWRPPGKKQTVLQDSTVNTRGSNKLGKVLKATPKTLRPLLVP